MKKVWWQVEYDFVDTKWGKRAMYIRNFKTLEEAEEFANTKEDAVILWAKEI